MEKVITWELCKKLKFNYSIKWYMHKPESILENETLEILWDIEIQTDYLISARRPDLVIVAVREIERKREKVREIYSER